MYMRISSSVSNRGLRSDVGGHPEAEYFGDTAEDFFFAKLSYFVHADKCIYTCSLRAILGAYENTASLAERLKVFAAVQLGE